MGAAAVGLIGGAGTKILRAQQLPSSEAAMMIPFVSQQGSWNAVVADVLFLQSWRLELRPVGDEGGPSFASDLMQFRTSVFAARGQLVARLQAQGQELNTQRQTFLKAFNDRRSRYREFLTEIGVAPDGRAGERLTRSTFVFANLALAAVGVDAVRTARQRSFLWPFC
jgi:hypothetical protein